MKIGISDDIPLPTLPSYGGPVSVLLGEWKLDIDTFVVIDSWFCFTLYDNNGSASVSVMSLDVQLVIGGDVEWVGEPSGNVLAVGSAVPTQVSNGVTVGMVPLHVAGIPVVKASFLSLIARLRVQTVAVPNADGSRRLSYDFGVIVEPAPKGTPGLFFLDKVIDDYAIF